MTSTQASSVGSRLGTSKKSRRSSVSGLGLALGAFLVACVAGFAWLAFNALQPDTSAEGRSAKIGKPSAPTRAEQAHVGRGTAEATPANIGISARSVDEELHQAGDMTQRALAVNQRMLSQSEDVPALKQRLQGVSLQLENRERSQALVDEALASDSLSAEERSALEARNDKMITKLAAYHQEVAQLQERIRTLEASR